MIPQPTAMPSSSSIARAYTQVSYLRPSRCRVKGRCEGNRNPLRAGREQHEKETPPRSAGDSGVLSGRRPHPGGTTFLLASRCFLLINHVRQGRVIHAPVMKLVQVERRYGRPVAITFGHQFHLSERPDHDAEECSCEGQFLRMVYQWGLSAIVLANTHGTDSNKPCAA